ncbi:MBL fold metallo-hydrolase [Paenibacillus marinisediminis]
MKLSSISLFETGDRWRCTFLGTGDSLGVPRVYCECEICNEARATGVNRRLRSSVLLYKGDKRLLIDCGPDWTLQMEMTGLRFMPDILITHAHHDHIAGIPAYADVCRWTKCRGNVIAPQEVLDLIKRIYPWVERHIQFISIQDKWQWDEWLITPIRVNHGKNGYSYAYRLERPEPVRTSEGSHSFSWLYASDAIGLGADELEHFKRLDVLILGTSFYHEPYPYETRSVYDMMEGLALIQEVQPVRTVFTHMSHGVDIRDPYLLPDSVQLSYAGLTIEV